MPLTKYYLTSIDINGILLIVVVLGKLVMPVADGVPCVGSIFYFPQQYLINSVNNIAGAI